MNNRLKNCLLAFVVLLTVVLVCQKEGWAEESLEERFLREAPDGWRRLRAQAERVVGVLRFDLTNFKDGQPGRRMIWDVRFKKNGKWVLCEINSVRGISRFDVLTNNSKYGFMLKRKNRNKDWWISQVGDDKIRVVASEFARTIGFGVFLRCPWTLGGFFPWDETVSHPSFKIKKISEEIRQGRTLVKLNFEAAIELREPKQSPVTLRGGWVLFDPSASWSVQEYRVKMDPHQGTQHGQIEYEVQEGLSKPHKIESTGAFAPGMTNTMSVEFKKIEYRSAPESEFMISAYGFDEYGSPADDGRIVCCYGSFHIKCPIGIDEK